MKKGERERGRAACVRLFEALGHAHPLTVSGRKKLGERGSCARERPPASLSSTITFFYGLLRKARSRRGLPTPPSCRPASSETFGTRTFPFIAPPPSRRLAPPTPAGRPAHASPPVPIAVARRRLEPGASAFASAFSLRASTSTTRLSVHRQGQLEVADGRLSSPSASLTSAQFARALPRAALGEPWLRRALFSDAPSRAVAALASVPAGVPLLPSAREELGGPL